MGGFGTSRWWVAVTVWAMVAAGCSSGGKNGAPNGPSTSAPGAEAFTVSLPVVSPPPAQGKGVNEPQPAAPLPDGYVEQEVFVGGTATSFDAVDTPNEGRWTAKPGKTAQYRTRVIVRRPPANKFSGTV